MKLLRHFFQLLNWFIKHPLSTQQNYNFRDSFFILSCYSVVVVMSVLEPSDKKKDQKIAEESENSRADVL